MSISRRGFLSGIIAFGCAPAIVRVGSLMPVKAMPSLTLDELPMQVWQPVGKLYPELTGMPGAYVDFSCVTALLSSIGAK